jgi:hypothetical protein
VLLGIFMALPPNQEKIKYESEREIKIKIYPLKK